MLNIDYKNLITEDCFVNWIKDNGGVLHTRKFSNIQTTNLSQCKPFTFVCLTGYSNIVEQFFTNIIHNFKNKIILITLETDGFIMKDEYLNNALLHQWFTWNKQYDHPKLTCIPIGLNHERHLDPLLKSLSKNNYKLKEKTKLFAVNLSVSSNPDRIKLIEIAKTKWSSYCTFIENIPFSNTYFRQSIIEGRIKIDVTNSKCYDILSEYKFILSPPGAGIDCHRTWEALYTGTIPIIISSSINEIYTDMPVLIINDWNEITQEFLELKYEEIQVKLKNNEYNMDKLYFYYWRDLIYKSVNIEQNNLLNINYSLKKDNYNIHFITYGNHKFELAKQRLLKEAEEFGEFKTISGYGPSDLPRDFIMKYKDILSLPRGGGYWIWRPIILLNKLETMNNEEFLVFLDAGCKLNPMGKLRFHEYIRMLNDSKYGIMSFQMSGNNGPGGLEKEKRWTNAQIFKYLNVDLNSHYANSGQYLGGILVMKKNEHLIKIIKLLIKALEYDSQMFTDYYNNNNSVQHKEFKENRHEQSVFSLLRKIHGSVVIDGDESWMVPFGEGKSLKYPFWATRSKV
jgi:hypothetical protein